MDGIAGDAPTPPPRATESIAIVAKLAHELSLAPAPPPSPSPSPVPISQTPLSDELFSELLSACEVQSVPVPLALAIMEQESRFDANVVSSAGCYGLMQLNPEYFPSGLTSAENIWAGVGYIGELLSDSDTTAEAVTAYFYGPSDRTSSWYSDEVLKRMTSWETKLCEKTEASE